VFCPIRQQSNKRVPRSLRFLQGAGACNARCGRTLGKINASNRLIDLECAQLSGLRVNMAPVAKAKRHVAILLNLEYHDVAAQRVNRASRQENGIAGLRSEPYKVVCHRPVCDRSPKTGCSDARLQARIDAAFCRGFQHDPCFGLRGLARGIRFVFSFLGCTWTESISCASRNFSSSGNLRKRPAGFPRNCSGNCSSN
jgi:hypothetical protein